MLSKTCEHSRMQLVCMMVFTREKKQNFRWLALFEPPHDKNNKMTFAPSEDSDQPGHPPSLISLHCPHEAMGPQLPIERTAKTDQTGQMPGLI